MEGLADNAGYIVHSYRKRQMFLFDVAEIEQLVRQIQQAVGILTHDAKRAGKIVV